MNTKNQTKTEAQTDQSNVRKVELVGGALCGDTVLWPFNKEQQTLFRNKVFYTYELDSENKKVAVCICESKGAK